MLMLTLRYQNRKWINSTFARMKKILISLLVLAACSPKPQGPNKYANDEKLIAIYEFQDQRKTDKLLPLLKAKKESHRIAAALAFASIQDTVALPYLNQMLQIDQDPMPRRAAAYALGQIGSTKALGILKSAFDGELYPPNRRYILEAIGKCGDENTIQLFEENNYQDSLLQMGWAYGAFRLALRGYTSKSLNNRMIELLNDENKDLAILASHYVYRELRNNKNIELVDSLTVAAKYYKVKERFMLLKPLELSNSDKAISQTFGRPWLSEFEKSNTYQKVAKINDLKSEYTSAQKFLQAIIQSDSSSAILKNAAFSKYCEFYPEKKWNIIIQALKSGDMAFQSLAALEIRNKTTEIESKRDEFELEVMKNLESVKSQVKLPEQAETYIDICKAIEALGGEKFEGYQPKYNHPIDWDYVKTIPADQQVTIETNEGIITLQLFVEDAPGTVSNFLQLADSGFYDKKYFHRVVPQFVIQGGCPRGDGWGSLDWTQRSEFSNYQTYETGTAGIASAGKDTEGVQFFVTHCPTPHLDGRYTIFARVVDGMDVVNKVQVGDRILKIEKK